MPETKYVIIQEEHSGHNDFVINQNIEEFTSREAADKKLLQLQKSRYPSTPNGYWILDLVDPVEGKVLHEIAVSSSKED